MIKRDTVVKTIGKSFADTLDTVVIDVSQELSFTRREMVDDLQCANFNAAARLSKVLKRLKIFSAAKLYQTDPLSLARTRGIGQASIFVAMCILDTRRYDVAKWWGWNGTNKVKFSTASQQRSIRKVSKRKHEV